MKKSLLCFMTVLALSPLASVQALEGGFSQEGSTVTIRLKVSPNDSNGQLKLVYPTSQGEYFPMYSHMQFVNRSLEVDGEVIGTIDNDGNIQFNDRLKNVSDNAFVDLTLQGIPNSGTLMGKGKFDIPGYLLYNDEVLSDSRVTFPTANEDPFGGTYGVIHPQDPSLGGQLIDIYTNPTKGLGASVLALQMTVPEGMTFDVSKNQGTYQSGVVSEVTGYQSKDQVDLYFVKEAVAANALNVSQFQPNGRRLDVVLTKEQDFANNQHVERVYVGSALLTDPSLVQNGVLSQPIVLTSPAGTVSLTALYQEDQVPQLLEATSDIKIDENGEEAESKEEESLEWSDTQDETANTLKEALSPEEIADAVEVPFTMEEKESLTLHAGERKVIRKGVNGYTKDGTVLQEAISQLDEVGIPRTITPYITTRRPNPALNPGDEVVVEKGQYGLTPKERSRVEAVPKVDEVIEFSPNGPNGVTYTPYQTLRQENSQMLEGQERVIQQGAFGEVVNGEETLAPQDEIIEYGTKEYVQDVVIPYGVTRRPNNNLPAGVEEVVQKGVNGSREGKAVVREPVQQIIEFGPSNSKVKEVAPIPYQITYIPKTYTGKTEDIGQSVTKVKGELGEKTYQGEIVKKAVNAEIEYVQNGLMPASYVAFKTIYQPNLDLKPGEQIVKKAGVYGRRSSNGSISNEAIDQVIEYGPNEDGSVPNLNQLTNPFSLESPYYRIREKQKSASEPVQDSNGMLMPELPGGTMTPDNLEAAVYAVYQSRPSASNHQRGPWLILGAMVVLAGAGFAGFFYWRNRQSTKDVVQSKDE